MLARRAISPRRKRDTGKCSGQICLVILRALSLARTFWIRYTSVQMRTKPRKAKRAVDSIVVPVRMPIEMVDQLRKIAEQDTIPLSTAARQAIARDLKAAA